MSTFYPAAVRPRQPGQLGAGSTPAERTVGWCAAAAIIMSLLIMVGAGLLRQSWMPPLLPLPSAGPPWELAVHVPGRVVYVTLWIGAVLAAGGVAAGLAAVRRGLPVPWRLLLVVAAIAAAALVLLPPIGSTDALDYAIFGHIAALGRSPYVMTPAQYQLLTHLSTGVPVDWVHTRSSYGPLATAEQLAAAKLGGASLARTVFWLKLWNAVAFGAVAFAADRMMRDDAPRRMRAHLLWTLNPLLIWSFIAAGHLDILAAAIGLAGLLICDRWVTGQPWQRALVAGLCVGAAADIKADYLLFGLAICWALRRKPGELLIAVAGIGAVLAPSYAIVGTSALKALAARAGTESGYGFYEFFLRPLGLSHHLADPIAIGLMLPVAWLALTRLPAGINNSQAVRAALALSLTWLLLWPPQFAWYSVMIICVLLFYPATRLDWIALAWLSAITIADIPGLGLGTDARLGHALTIVQLLNNRLFAPLVMLAAAVVLVVLCCTGRWHPAKT